MTESAPVPEKRSPHSRGIQWSAGVLLASVVLTAVSIGVVLAVFGDGFNAVVPAMIVLFVGGAIAAVSAVTAVGFWIALLAEQRRTRT
jgi:F0F1-type ATP synthase assembly protein I